MAIPSEWAVPPVEWAGLPVSLTLPYLRVLKVCLMRPGRIEQTVELRRWGKGRGRGIAICGSLTAHFSFKNRC